MSFQEDVKRHQDALLRMVDAGVPVAAAALAVGITRGRAYGLLRACGYGVGPKTVVTAEHRRRCCCWSWRCSSSRAMSALLRPCQV